VLLFRLYQLASAAALADGVPIEALADRPVLFLEGENRKDMAPMTAALHARLRPPKELVSLRMARARMMAADDLRAYDRRVSGFFALSLNRRSAANN
jgi:hypothetical protein